MRTEPKNAAEKELGRLLGPCRRAGILLAFLSTLQSLLLVLLALAVRGVINGALGAAGGFALWCGVLPALAAAIPLLRGAASAYAGQTSDRAAALLRQRVLELLQRKDCGHINSYHSGCLFSRIVGDCRTVCERYTSLLPAAAGQVIQLAGAAATLAILQLQLAAVILAGGGLTALGGLLFRRVLKVRHLAVRRTEEEMTACLQEHLEHLELCRSIAAESEVSRRFQRRQKDWRMARTSLRRAAVGGGTAFSLLVQVGSAAVILWGALAIRTGALSFGDLTAVLQLMNLFRSPVSGLTGLQSQLAAADAAGERLLQLWRLPEEPAGVAAGDGAVCRALVFDDVTFCYEGEEQPVFRHFSARIELGRWTCLAGVSGRGKSTLYRLILGLYRPQSGRIEIETDRGTVPCSAATRGMFSFVPQTPILFSGTLRENLLLARPGAADMELWEVLNRAECGFVRELPDGLDTVLGETGQGLSVGQRQRVAVARALLSGAQVLLLDEATSALDRETEARLLENLAKAHPSVLIATHRPDTLRDIKAERLDLEAASRG